VEHRGARQPLTAQPGKTLDRAAAADDASARETMPWRHAAISSGSDNAIEQEAGTHRDLAARQRSIERQGERKRTNGMRCDACDGPPLAHRLARAADVERLQIPQPAVNRAQMVERCAAAEVVLLDE